MGRPATCPQGQKGHPVRLHPRPGTESGTRRLARQYPAALLGLLLCSTGGALAALALPAALGHTVDRLVAGGPVPWSLLLLCAALTLAETGFDAAAAVTGTSTTARLTASLRTRTAARVLAAEPRRALALPTGDLTARLTARTADAASAPVTAAGAVSGVLLPLGALVGLLLIDVWTAVALLLGAPSSSHCCGPSPAGPPTPGPTTSAPSHSSPTGSPRPSTAPTPSAPPAPAHTSTAASWNP